MSHVIIGTAGHIDHGKSTLVRALTGTDPDRLPEEKRRGITTDLGYAFLDDVAAIIDVPGHERLVHNMVAGAATIDFGLLVVAADDGVMPQSLEHLQILKLLAVRAGAIVITKCDSVEPGWLDLVEGQIREAVRGTFLESAGIYRVDSVTRTGLPEFRAALLERVKEISPRSAAGVFRLPIDRVFVVKGRGTVVTGTILSGAVSENARLVAMPGGFDVRAKQLQTHGQDAPRLQAGQRAALNLVGNTERITRGMTLSVEHGFLETTRVAALVELLPHIPMPSNRQRVRVLIGTQEVIGRLVKLFDERSQPMIVQLLLEEPVIACWQDRFILRRYSPMETLGGGIVVEPQATRVRLRDRAREVQFIRSLVSPNLAAAMAAVVEHGGANGAAIQWLASFFGREESEIRHLAKESGGALVIIGDLLIARHQLNLLTRRIIVVLAKLHDEQPESGGFAGSEIRLRVQTDLPDAIFAHVVHELEATGEIVRDQAAIRLAVRGISLSEAQLKLNERVFAVIVEGGFAPPAAQVIANHVGAARPDVEKALVLLEKTGRCKRLSVDLFFSKDSFAHAVEIVRRALAENGTLSVSEAAALLKSSRKYVVPLLEYLDGIGLTVRDANVRRRGPKFSGA